MNYINVDIPLSIFILYTFKTCKQFYITCIQQSIWNQLRRSINGLSNHKFSIKKYNIQQYDTAFKNYPNKPRYLQHRNNLLNWVNIGLTEKYPPRLSNNNPSFSISEKIGIAQQLEKWLKTGIVLGPFDKNYAEKNNITLHMLFGVPKPDSSTRPILNLSDKKIFHYSINDLIDPKLCTVEYAQTKQW